MEKPETKELEAGQVQMGGLGRALSLAGLVVGAGALAAASRLGSAEGDGMRRFWQAYLVNYCYFLSLSLGALFFVLLQHITRAQWSVVVRRLGEVVAANMPLMAALAIPILANIDAVYGWAGHPGAAHDQLLQWKRPYLNEKFFAVRLAIYFFVWISVGLFYLKNSTAQDKSGDAALTLRMERFSGPAMMLFALTVTFASFDLLMSLRHSWFSTMFGVYFFAGCAVGFFALLIVAAAGLQMSGRLARVVSAEHYHDMGKFLFGFIFFWGYVAFCQYMLMWYANMPEETEWFLARQRGGWLAVSLLLLFGHFLLPFLGLITRGLKRSKLILCGWAVWMLAMHWVDIYWAAAPEFSPARVPFGALDVLCFAGLGGLFLAGIAGIASARPLAPVRDPRLKASLAFRNSP